MSQTSSQHLPTPGRSVVLPDIDWRTYSRLLYLFAERPAIRLTYDRGELEIIAPSPELHDGRCFGALVCVLTEELEMPLKRGGSTTLRRRRLKRGIEADECFWIANAHRMAGRRRLDLRTDPPPDLAVEVDVTHSSLDRMSIYARLGVPEVWRLKGDALTFHVLGEGSHYSLAATSRTFPMVTPADLIRFVQEAREAGDQNAVLRTFREWVRERRAAAERLATGTE
jgi:Uma2 family endonuclease